MTDDVVEEFLAHFGKKGMKWGVRNNSSSTISRATNKEAKKDAEEFARAKLFYGQGAGTRRKLIKNTVEAKAKRDPNYKKAFDSHFANQNLADHAQKARSERHRKDTVSTTTKTAKGVHRQLTGGFGNVSLASAVLAGGFVAAKRSGIDQVIKKAAQTTYANMRANRGNRSSGMSAQDILRRMGAL